MSQIAWGTLSSLRANFPEEREEYQEVSRADYGVTIEIIRASPFIAERAQEEQKVTDIDRCVRIEITRAKSAANKTFAAATLSPFWECIALGAMESLNAHLLPNQSSATIIHRRMDSAPNPG